MSRRARAHGCWQANTEADWAAVPVPTHPSALGQHIEFGPDHIIDALPPENWNSKTREYDE